VRVTVRIEEEAEHQAEYLSAWWREHRTAARPLKEQLREAFDRIAAAPYLPAVYTELEGTPIRRLGIKRTPYAVYYYVDEAKSEAVVISIWSGQRGEGPPLRVR
jgi:plasmid stabilization system protein ParE